MSVESVLKSALLWLFDLIISLYEEQMVTIVLRGKKNIEDNKAHIPSPHFWEKYSDALLHIHAQF